MSLTHQLQRHSSYLRNSALALLAGSSLVASAQDFVSPNSSPDIYFSFFLRDSKGMPVGRELSPNQTYTAELWARKEVSSSPTFRIDGKVTASPSQNIRLQQASELKPYHVWNNQTNDFFYFPGSQHFVQSTPPQISNQFTNTSFSRSIPIASDASQENYIPEGITLGEGVIASYTFRTEGNELQRIVLSAEVASYAYDGTSTNKEHSRVISSEYALVPSPRPADRSLMLIDKVGLDLTRVYVPGIGQSLLLQSALAPLGPWKDEYQIKVHEDNKNGSLDFIDYGPKQKQKFFRVMPGKLLTQ